MRRQILSCTAGGAFALLLLMAVLTPGIYPALIELPAARMATVPRDDGLPGDSTLLAESALEEEQGVRDGEHGKGSEVDVKPTVEEAMQRHTEGENRPNDSVQLLHSVEHTQQKRSIDGSSSAGVERVFETPSNVKNIELSPAVIAGSVDHIRRAQRELKRVGCFVGRPDGQLAKSTEDALMNYWSLTGQSITEVKITNDLIEDVRRHHGRVCKSDHTPIPMARPMQAPSRETSSTPLAIVKHPSSKETVASADRR